MSLIKRFGLIIFSLLVLLVSFVPMFSSSIKEASADSVTERFTFVGSDIFVPYGRYNLTTTGKFSHPATDFIGSMNFQLTLSTFDVVNVSNGAFSISNCPAPSFIASYASNNRVYQYLYTECWLDAWGYVQYGYPNSVPVCTYAYNVDSEGNAVNLTDISNLNDKTIIRYTNFFSTTNIAYETQVLEARVNTYVEYGFSSNVISVRMYGKYFSPADYGSNNTKYENHIVYTDSLGYTCDVVVSSYIYNGAVITDNDLRSRLVFDDRTYYLTTALNDNEAFQLGYAEGEANKIAYGENEVKKAEQKWFESFGDRLQERFNDGVEEGKILGYQEAVGSSFGLTPFLTSAFSALDVKIFGVFSLGELFALIVGVSLVFIVLKIFAGG